LKENARPADTFILCNPPYSLADHVPISAKANDYYSGSDATMERRYDALIGTQTMQARLSTLVNIDPANYAEPGASSGTPQKPVAPKPKAESNSK
jgi:hypothetical protein